MILDFSSLGSGTGTQVDLCPDCRYFIRIQWRSRVPTVAWLNGAEVMRTYGSHDVKITVRGIKRCRQHSSRMGAQAKTKPEFLNAALRSGIDISEDVDDYRSNILRTRHPNMRF